MTSNAVGEVDDSGRASGAVWIGSPNFDARSPGGAISLLVIHNISLPPGEFGGDGIMRLFSNTLDYATHPYYESLRGLRVSSHFLIDRDGVLLQFVACLDRAWHAGLSKWRGRDGCNDFSLGVELEGVDNQPYTDAQYETLAQLTRALRRRYPIGDVAGHSDISPGRKSDPGPAFDWQRLGTLLEL